MKELKVVTVVQARTGSSRLPRKVLMSICGQPLLIRMVERVRLSELCGQVVVATSTEKEDDAIEELCISHKLDFYRGSLNDLLDRHYKVGKKYNADAVVKIPSDCPLIDPHVIDKVIKNFLDNYPEYDFVSNLHPASFPDGNDVEIMKMSVLEKAHKKAKRKLEREHTTPYIWENPDKFKINNILWETNHDFSSTHRWTIDYEEDYVFIRTVYEELYPHKPNFSLYDILNLLEEKPYIYIINNKYAGRYWYENHLDELENIDEFKEKTKKGKNNNI
ncbi:MAG: glycosyltransferase family protein [Ignavibacteria bacterium]|jgi:spore coat polysaccharide biosynthesis protein SpsF